MAKPPSSGPHSDITGVNRDARVGEPDKDPGLGTAADTQKADTESKAKPDEDTVNIDKSA